MSLFEAMNETAVTANGAVTNHSTLSRCVDLFSIIGSSRWKDLTHQLEQSLNESHDMTYRMLQWVRDCRGGAGERDTFHKLLRHLVTMEEHHEAACGIVCKLPELGYWKDLVKLYDVPLFQPLIKIMFDTAYCEGNGLWAKYMPRKGPIANDIRKYLGLTPKEYRRTLVLLSETVEQKMCAKEWNQIDFSKIPSLASARYQKAFSRNAAAEYSKYISALKKGEAKINASVLYPYDVLKSVMSGIEAVAEQQWKALPNYMEGTDERILPVIDVSGSMAVKAGASDMTCMQVAISLGMYVSERNEGVFKDQFITFDRNPTMHKASGTLTDRYKQIMRSPWGMNTDIQKVFATVLYQASSFNVPEEQMPTTVIVFSDMEFDSSYISGNDATAMKAIDYEYERNGYKRPKLVFWNLKARPGNCPVTVKDGGTAAVSGFSPAILKAILSAADFNPETVMRETLMVERYAL